MTRQEATDILWELTDQSETPLLCGCSLLHMHNTGAMDPIQEPILSRLIEALQTRQKTWTASCAFTLEYDLCVQKLLLTVLREYRDR